MLYQENGGTLKIDVQEILNIYLHTIMAPPPPLNKVKDFRAIF